MVTVGTLPGVKFTLLHLEPISSVCRKMQIQSSLEDATMCHLCVIFFFFFHFLFLFCTFSKLVTFISGCRPSICYRVIFEWKSDCSDHSLSSSEFPLFREWPFQSFRFNYHSKQSGISIDFQSIEDWSLNPLFLEWISLFYI